MQVFKTTKPILALALLATVAGNNFGELSSEVSEVGGTAELINDGLARVNVNGRTYDLPIGYVLVFDSGHGRLISKERFADEYVSVDTSSFDLDDLVARIEKVESELDKLNKANTEAKKTKAEPKVKGTKVNDLAVNN